MKFASKFILILICLGLVLYAIFWLWQRQPGVINQADTIPSQEVNSKNEQVQNKIEPQDTSVLSEKIAKIEGTVKPQQLILAYSNSSQKFTTSNSKGEFKIDFELTDGLNELNITTFKNQNEIDEQKIFVYYLKTKTQEISADTVYAGTVKSILENSLTITTLSGEKTVKIDNATKLQAPQIEVKKTKEKESTNSASTAFRVGDFIITLGDKPKNNELLAKNVQIIRENKPQLIKQLISSKVQSTVSQNIFSVKNNKDNKLVELVASKDSQVISDGKNAKTADVTKDKKALILYHTENDENILDLLYLTP
jgi:hypothetical protein